GNRAPAAVARSVVAARRVRAENMRRVSVRVRRPAASTCRPPSPGGHADSNVDSDTPAYRAGSAAAAAAVVAAAVVAAAVAAAAVVAVAVVAVVAVAAVVAVVSRLGFSRAA